MEFKATMMTSEQLPKQLNEYTCQELVELMTEYYEAALTPQERASFEQHLSQCTGCRNYLDQMRWTIDALGQVETPPIPADTLAALVGLFRAWKNADA